MKNSLVSSLVLALLSLSRSGHGQFTKVQQAIDFIPAMNSVWTHILVKPGIYKEKVIVPRNKPCIVLEGHSARDTVIQWADSSEVTRSATFTVNAENFKARNIKFQTLWEFMQNTYNENTQRGDLNPIKQAPAFQTTADKVSFYQCAFIGVQDTLSDLQGRHYFESCYIEGAIDFIWGGGQSFYQGCTINATAAIQGRLTGYITAQGRKSETDTSGYVFNQCTVVGTGLVYLGRAYMQYSRVVFSKTYLLNVVVPKGWNPWRYVGREQTITYTESQCIGLGANMSKRVKWEKTLSSKDLAGLTNVNAFVNQDGWLQKQPF
ncbi:hypothetical protein BT93_G0241 [Corymbia citriodora subsp. variegata]|nr:hypothetical protein BT93_G0241 [Corymbia citriodora subsp. variegata]